MQQAAGFREERQSMLVSLGAVVWFDTEDGRVFSSSRKAEGGQRWLTFAPADNARIIQHLSNQVQPYLQR